MAKLYTLSKDERIHSTKTIEALFNRKSDSFVVYPFRLVYRFDPEGEQARSAILCSVSKKKFKRANKRNHVKRQIKEAYRLNKLPLLEALEETDKSIAIAFLFLPGSLKESDDIQRKMQEAVNILIEKIR